MRSESMIKTDYAGHDEIYRRRKAEGRPEDILKEIETHGFGIERHDVRSRQTGGVDGLGKKITWTSDFSSTTKERNALS